MTDVDNLISFYPVQYNHPTYQGPRRHEIENCRVKIKDFFTKIAISDSPVVKSKRIGFGEYNCSLYQDLMVMVMKYLTPIELLNLSMTSKYFYHLASQNQFWKTHTEHLKDSNSYKLLIYRKFTEKEAFCYLFPYVELVQEVNTLLDNLEKDLLDRFEQRPPNARIYDKCRIETIFSEYLDQLPWSSHKHIKILEKEVESLVLIPNVQLYHSDSTVMMQFVFDKGLYKNYDSVTFKLEYSPTGEFVIISISEDIDHPYINDYSIYVHPDINTKVLNLQRIINLIYESFTDFKTFTNNFNF